MIFLAEKLGNFNNIFILKTQLLKQILLVFNYKIFLFVLKLTYYKKISLSQLSTKINFCQFISKEDMAIVIYKQY